MSKRLRLSQWHSESHTVKPAAFNVSRLHEVETNVKGSMAMQEAPLLSAITTKIDIGTRTNHILCEGLRRVQRIQEHADLLWWSSLSHSHKGDFHPWYRIGNVQRIAKDLLVVSLEGRHELVFMNIDWLRRQRQHHRPLKFIHPSLEDVSDTMMIDRLLELLGTAGCKIHLNDSALLAGEEREPKDSVLVTTRFLLELDNNHNRIQE